MDTVETGGTKLEALQAYPLGSLEVEFRNWRNSDGSHPRGLLRGLYQSDVDEYALVDFGESDRGMCEVEARYCVPVLHAFEDLLKPLHDGSIPLYQYVRFMWPKEGAMRHHAYGDFIEVHGSTALYLMKRNDFEKGSLHCLGAKYLQKLHFAVGLKADQFIPKQA